MRDIKFEIMFTVSNKDFTKSIKKHYTTLERLTDGTDIFKYGFVDIVAKRQFTGLTDKNGVDIYEGDILNIVDTLPRKGDSYLTMFKPVIFNFGCFEVNPCEDTGLFLCEIASDEHHEGSHRCFVAGNIHENPELLKTNKIEE